VVSATDPHEAERTQFQTHCFSQNLIEVGIELGTCGTVARISDHMTTEAAILRIY
jgi:hypothetical protein